MSKITYTYTNQDDPECDVDETYEVTYKVYQCSRIGQEHRQAFIAEFVYTPDSAREAGTLGDWDATGVTEMWREEMTMADYLDVLEEQIRSLHSEWAPDGDAMRNAALRAIAGLRAIRRGERVPVDLARSAYAGYVRCAVMGAAVEAVATCSRLEDLAGGVVDWFQQRWLTEDQIRTRAKGAVRGIHTMTSISSLFDSAVRSPGIYTASLVADRIGEWATWLTF